MKTSLRPPTQKMIEKLKDCLNKQTSNDGTVPCLPEEMRSSLPGLYKRGFIVTRMETFNKKKQLCIYVTEAGKIFLARLPL